MRKIKVLNLSPDDQSFKVYSASFDTSQTIYYTSDSEQTINQGFCGHCKSYFFHTLGECGNLIIEVWQADQEDEINIKPDSVRAIQVPFLASNKGVMITNFIAYPEELIQIDEGNYALVFELKLRNDAEYLSSSQYQQDVKDGFTEEYCYLTFYQRTKLPEPEILRIDTWLSPPYDFDSYYPLKPTYPLLLEVAPTHETV